MNVSAIDIVVAVKESREALRTLAGDKYAEQLAPWKEALAAIFQLPTSVNRMGTVLYLMKQLDEAGKLDEGGAGMYLLAAAGELIEEEAAARRVDQ